MAIPIITLFVYTLLATSNLGNFPLGIENTAVRLLTEDTTHENLFLEIDDIKFLEGLENHQTTPVGIDISILEILLRDVFGRCFDLDNPDERTITLRRDVAPFTYTGEASAVVYKPDYEEIGSVTRDRYIVEFDLESSQHLFARTNEIEGFRINIPTVACI